MSYVIKDTNLNTTRKTWNCVYA